ncbi:hypothetical protein [Serratia ureilytica]|uniref:hypothetical protein n=1 Tax=Serratia TaxID=613 RepID=UPI0018D8F69C|nr:hypothetical protein [Serratia ureilytica]MBH2696213.1 hypothetical protein [Serratia marcescens]MBH2515354.1 hypothetical protein [Serratia ureilytica]MBH2531920.1 hypothetical protein [Serratia ureilytica]MBH2807119.1 hypothetical protein [Serratia marcescens]MBN5234744.1 hypothetical protein [Serratia marcescens]
MLGAIQAHLESIKHPVAEKEILLNKLKLFISSFHSEPEKWDEYTPLNIEKIGEEILNHDNIGGDVNVDIYLLHALCFRFLIERSITDPDGINESLESVKKYTIENIEQFPEKAKNHIKYGLLAMPTDIFKYRIGSSELALMRVFIDSEKSSKETFNQWSAVLSDKEKKVEELKSALENHETAFNFVGLHDGFQRLGSSKTKELRTATWIIGILAILILFPVAGEFLFIYNKGESLNITHALISAVPASSLILILIYYFRIALQDYKSIKAQLNQIELRKSLCMFIQSYADYSMKIKSSDSNILDKFENIIFSNILMSDEKLPSTFDGLDSIASIVKEIKIRP